MVFTFELHDIDGDRVNPMKTRKVGQMVVWISVILVMD